MKSEVHWNVKNDEHDMHIVKTKSKKDSHINAHSNLTIQSRFLDKFNYRAREEKQF